MDGPPPGGVFLPGRADALVRPGAPLKLELVDPGREPRAPLLRTLEGSAPQALQLVLSVRQGPQGSPPLGFTLAVATRKGKGEGETVATATVKKVKPQLPAGEALPKEVEALFGGLAGAEVALPVDARGQVGKAEVKVGKGVDPQLGSVLGSLGDTLADLVVPLPAEALGVGATWMVTDRSLSGGIDVVRYRAYSLQSQSGGATMVSVQIRKYAASDRLALGAPGQEPLTLQVFDSQGKGTFQLSSKAILPLAADVEDRIQGLLVPPGGAGSGPDGKKRGMPIELSVQAVVSTLPTAP